MTDHLPSGESHLALPAVQFGAGIQGIVTGQTGAVVKGAKVTVTNDASGTNRAS